jgi:hypothetical protein
MNPKTQTYTKINTLYKRFQNLKKVDLPKKEWIKFQNKIMMGSFTEPHFDLLFNCDWDCFSKIDGTNSKIVYYPSTGLCFCGGKTDNAEIVGTGQKAYLDAVIERIKPILGEMFPPEMAKFAPVMNENNKIQYRFPEGGEKIADITAEDIRDYGTMWAVDLEEVPIYIYGEFYGKKIQKGGNYDKEKNRFAVFDICQQGWYVPVSMLYDYCKKLDLEVVPYIGAMSLNDAEAMVEEGFKTRVKDAANPDYLEEGIVARPVVPIKDSRGKRIIVKIKTCDYQELKRTIDEVGDESYNEFYEWYLAHQEEIEASK